MTYREILPTPQIADVVRYFWIIESDETTLPQTYRLFAESSPGMVFFHHHNYALISGINDSFRDFQMRGPLGMVGAFLYPYALPLLFNVPSNEIVNTTVEINDFLGGTGKELRDRVCLAQNNDERISIITNYIVQRKLAVGFTATGLSRGVRDIVRHSGDISIDDLMNDMKVSARQLDRRFATAVGIPPKFFSRLMRFHSSLRLPLKKKINSLTDLALDAGYYDQSHFIRDFRSFAGLSPGQYFGLHPDYRADNFITLKD